MINLMAYELLFMLGAEAPVDIEMQHINWFARSYVAPVGYTLFQGPVSYIYIYIYTCMYVICI